MRTIAVNHTEDRDRRAFLPVGWEVWSTSDPIGPTYLAIAQTAIGEGWDNTVVVVQDDVRPDVPFVSYEHDLVLYGTQKGNHYCPRAFSASLATWEQLAQAWKPALHTVCSPFRDVVKWVDHLVLNQVTHLEPKYSRVRPRIPLVEVI